MHSFRERAERYEFADVRQVVVSDGGHNALSADVDVHVIQAPKPLHKNYVAVYEVLRFVVFLLLT